MDAGPFNWLWASCGFKTTNRPARTHPWYEPRPTADAAKPWCGSKVGFNLDHPSPLPWIGGADELWPEVVGTRYDLSECVSEAVRTKVATFLADLPKPVVALHTKGVTNGPAKDFPDYLQAETIRQLQAVGSVVHLDLDGGVVLDDRYRVASNYDVETLYELISQADCLVGIDSGPFHLARLTSTPRIGCWWGIPPWHASLPLPTDTNFFIQGHPVTPHRGDWNIKEVPEIKAELIAEAVNTLWPTSKYPKTSPP